MGKRVSGAAVAFFAPLTAAENQVNMSPGVTEIGADIFQLHMLIMWICVAIGVAVFAVMFYSITSKASSRLRGLRCGATVSPPLPAPRLRRCASKLPRNAISS